MLMELAAQLLGYVFGSAEGFTTALMLGLGAKYLRQAATLGGLLDTAAWFVGLLAALSILGVVTIHPDAAVSLVRMILGLLPVGLLAA